MKIALTTDHTGLDLIPRLQSFLENLGHECVNFSPKTLNESDDYPDFISPAAKSVASGECDRAIIMGGSGQGEAMVANRFKGVRCALYYGPAKAIEPVDAEGDTAQDEFEILRLSRHHNDANVLSLAARFLSQSDVDKAVTIWLETPFSGIDRHLRRIKEIDSVN
jgi:ribose 5-phosphate isomerase B